MPMCLDSIITNIIQSSLEGALVQNNIQIAQQHTQELQHLGHFQFQFTFIELMIQIRFL